MHRDIKDIVGVLMRVLGGCEVTRAEVMELSFEADGELLAALNEAYITLLEFTHDRESGGDNDEVFLKTRAGLQDCLDKILDACDREPAHAALANAGVLLSKGPSAARCVKRVPQRVAGT
jgi:hypothetical protein